MARAFKSTPKGFVAHLEKGERRLLRSLFDDVLTMLARNEPAARAQPRSAERPAGPSTEDRSTEDRSPEDESMVGRSAEGPSPDDEFWSIVAGLPTPEAPADDAADDAADGPAGGSAVGSAEASATPRPSSPPSRSAPWDPALARLLPAGVSGDDGAAAEFRGLTEDTVRETKSQDLRRAVAALQTTPVILDEASAVAFARALNDVRLVLATRLGIEDEQDAERVHAMDNWSAARDVDSTMALLYNFASWLQETLMTALSTHLDD